MALCGVVPVAAIYSAGMLPGAHYGPTDGPPLPTYDSGCVRGGQRTTRAQNSHADTCTTVAARPSRFFKFLHPSVAFIASLKNDLGQSLEIEECFILRLLVWSTNFFNKKKTPDFFFSIDRQS